MKESIYASYTSKGDVAFQFDEGTVIISADGTLVGQEGFCLKSVRQKYCDIVKKHAADKTVTSSDLRMLRIIGDAADVLNERAKAYPSDHIPTSYREIGITADDVRILDHETAFFAPGDLTGYVSDVLDESGIPYEGYSAPDFDSLCSEIRPDVPCLKDITLETIQHAFFRYPGMVLGNGMSIPFLVSKCDPEDLYKLSMKFYGENADENFINWEYDRGRHNFQQILYNWEEYGFSGEPGAGLNIIDPYGEQADGLSYYRLGTADSEGTPRLLLISTFNHLIDRGFYRDPEINKIYEVETKASQIILESGNNGANDPGSSFFEAVNEPVLNRFHGRPTNTDLTPLLTASAAYQAASPVAKAELEFIGNPAFEDPSAYYPEEGEEAEAFVVWVGEQYMLTFTEMGTYLSEEIKDENAAGKTAATGNGKISDAGKEPQYRNRPIRSAKSTAYLRKLFPERFEIFNRLTKVASGKMLP